MSLEYGALGSKQREDAEKRAAAYLEAMKVAREKGEELDQARARVETAKRELASAETNRTNAEEAYAKARAKLHVTMPEIPSTAVGVYDSEVERLTAERARGR